MYVLLHVFKKMKKNVFYVSYLQIDIFNIYKTFPEVVVTVQKVKVRADGCLICRH